jgi:hypothetical protein
LVARIHDRGVGERVDDRDRRGRGNVERGRRLGVAIERQRVVALGIGGLGLRRREPQRVDVGDDIERQLHVGWGME